VLIERYYVVGVELGTKLGCIVCELVVVGLGLRNQRRGRYEGDR